MKLTDVLALILKENKVKNAFGRHQVISSICAGLVLPTEAGDTFSEKSSKKVAGE